MESDRADIILPPTVNNYQLGCLAVVVDDFFSGLGIFSCATLEIFKKASLNSFHSEYYELSQRHLVLGKP